MWNKVIVTHSVFTVPPIWKDIVWAHTGRMHEQPQNHGWKAKSIFILVTWWAKDLCSSTQVEACKQGCRDQSLLESKKPFESPAFSWLSGILVDNSFPPHFDLSHSRAGISRMFTKVPLSPSQTYVIKTKMFYLSNPQGYTTNRMIYVFSRTVAPSHLSMFTTLLTSLLLFS